MLAIVARTGRRTPEFQEIPEPSEPAANEVLCRTLELGVCGTDREILESACPVTPLEQDFLVLGHECLGQVERVGNRVTELQAGDLVVPVVRRSLAEFSHVCRVDMLAFGQFVERGIYREHGFATQRWLDRPEYLIKVDPRIASVAVLTEPMAVSEKGVNEATIVQRGRLGPDAWLARPPRVLVTGQGPIGFTSLLASICRAWPVTMVGRDAPGSSRAELATRFGARYLPLELLNDEPVDVERDGFDLVLECTGSDAVMLDASRWLAARGVMVWLGSTRRPQPQPCDVQRMMRDGILRNHLHLATVNSAPRDFADALTHLSWLHRRFPEPLAAMITHRVPLSDSLQHYAGRVPQGIKAIVNFT